MITFREVAERIDTSEKNKAQIEIWNLLEELEVDGLCSCVTQDEFEKVNNGLDCYYIKDNRIMEFYGDETWKMYFLYGELIGVSKQTPCTSYCWFGIGKVKKIKEYLISLLRKDDSSYLDIISIEDEILEFYKLKDISNAIINKKHAYYRGEKVSELHIHTNEEDTFDVVITESDKFYDVPLSDLDFKLHILDEK